MTRRLLVVAAVVAVLGLAATPALEETAVGGWFSVPWEGNRGLGQPGQPASRRLPQLWIGRAGQPASELRMPSPARMVMDRRSGPPRASLTRRRPPGDRPATRTHHRGLVAGSRNRAGSGEGDINQQLAVMGSSRPNAGGRKGLR